MILFFIRENVASIYIQEIEAINLGKCTTPRPNDMRAVTRRVKEAERRERRKLISSALCLRPTKSVYLARLDAFDQPFLPNLLL